MINAFEGLPVVSDGDYPGAETYFNPLAARSHWLYNQAHALNYPFAQRWGTGIISPVWEGETPVRSEHLTLSFSARVELAAPDGKARLQYYSTSGWTDVLVDQTQGARHWFNGTQYNSISLSGLSPAQDMWCFRLQLTEAGGWAIVYRAYLTGTTGFPAWPSLPTFTDGAPVAAATLDKLRQMQEYLFACSKQSRASVRLGTATHGQSGSTETLYRWAFRYGCTRRLYYYLAVSGLTSGGHVYLYLIPETYDQNFDSRLATLADIAVDGNYSANIDLSTYGLTQGTRYGLEVTAYQDAVVTVGNVVLADLGAVTRTYMPKDNWQHGDTPTAAILTTVRNDLDAMYPATDRESPLWCEHDLASWQGPDSLGVTGPNYSAARFRGVRRWRYLRYRGAGRLVSADGTVTASLSDSDPAGSPQVLDLESINVPYGMEYYVEDYGSGAITVAYEDYA